MNILEALKTGKPFRRVGDAMWILAAGPALHLDIEDITAEDWETKEPTVKVTASQIVEAIYTHPRIPGTLLDDLCRHVCNELGLDDNS